MDMEVPPDEEIALEVEPLNESSPPPGLQLAPSGMSNMNNLPFQPKLEYSPQVIPRYEEEIVTEIPLTQALRRNPDILDGSYRPHGNNTTNFAREISIRPMPSIAFLMNCQQHKIKKKCPKD